MSTAIENVFLSKYLLVLGGNVDTGNNFHWKIPQQKISVNSFTKYMLYQRILLF